MKIAKFKIYFLELLLIIFLVFALFAPNIISRIVLAIFMFIYMFIVSMLLKRRRHCSTYDKQVMVLMLIFAILYLGIFYLLGLYYGFGRTKYAFNLYNVLYVVVPIIVIIVSAEMMRKIFLAQKEIVNFRGKKINLTYIAMTLVDLVIYTGVYDFSNLNDMLMALGFVFFASLSCNLLYNYVSIRYGEKPVIIYRLITTIYMYILPFIPDVYVFLRSFLRMLYPFIIYIILENTYSKSNLTVAYKDKKKNIFRTLIMLTLVTLMIMLISCQFHFGIIVIGSDSMTGTINKGDAIIFERYRGEKIEKGQVIMFNYNGIVTVHRIIEIRTINGEIRYITKGDANKNTDSGYRTYSDIVGFVRLRIKYIGKPTLWLRNLFEK